MELVEILLIIFALSLDVFLVAEYEGSNLRALDLKKISLISLIFFLGQLLSMTAGYLLTRLPIFLSFKSREHRIMGYIDAAVIFLFIAAVMLYRAVRREEIVERLRELRYRRITLEALAAAAFTFFGGIACGFMYLNPAAVFAMICVLTVLAAAGGLYAGYRQGCRFRKAGYTVSFCLFLAAGVEVLLRYV